MSQKTTKNQDDESQKEIKKRDLITVKSTERYNANPFLDQMVVTTREKRITVARGSPIIDLQTGVIEAQTEIAQIVSVDREQFVKLFTKDIAVWFDLSKAAQRVFGIVLKNTQTQALGKDVIPLEHDKSVQEQFSISRAVFFRGVTELIERQIIAKHKIMGLYFINPALIFNGDRARFVREYRVRTNTPADVKAREELEARGQQRLIE